MNRQRLNKQMRDTIDRMSIEQIRATYASTAHTYERFAREKGFEPHSTELLDGTKAHWIGSEDADKVIAHFHGGGYVFPATISLFHFMWDIRERVMRITGLNVSVVVESYDLAPAAQYPRQLQQGIAMLDYLMTRLRKRPSDIVISGNSAGGNLAMGVISHILHPHPSCMPLLTVSEPFAGLMLISPWISMCYSAASYQGNADHDVLHVSSLETWGDLWTGPAEYDAYIQPRTAPTDWWDGLDQVVSRILITAGGLELMVDDIWALGDALSQKAQVRTTIAADEMHDHAIIDLDFGYAGYGESARAIIDWSQEVFSDVGACARVS